MSTIKSVNVQHPSAASPNISLDSSGNVGIGTSSPATIFNAYNATSAIISVDGDSATQLRATRYSTDNVNPNLNLRKARGTLASPTAVSSGDVVGHLSMQAYGGTNFRGIGAIQGVVDTYTSDTNISGYLAFSTNSGSTGVTEQMRLSSAGNLQFNSGYGSLATAYGCRAWVNMDGTQVAASMIRASGNVTSITDNGTGDYTVNFTTAMPNTNYAVTVGSALVASDPVPLAGASRTNTPIITNLTTGSFSVGTVNAAGTAFVDAENIFLAVFR